MRSIFYLLLIGILASNCKTKRAVSSPEVNIDTSPKIVFLNYKFEKNAFVLSNKVLAEGKLKPTPGQDRQAQNGDLVFKQVDLEGSVLYQEVFPDPFQRRVEYTDENGLLTSKIVEIEHPEITIRSKLFPKAAFLILEEFHEKKSKIKLLSKTEI